MSDQVVARFRDVKKYFGATKALDGVDLDICANEVHAIVGSNGAGKSTLMKTLAGEYVPDEGRLYYLEENITGLSPMEIQKKGIQVVHQVLNIVESLTNSRKHSVSKSTHKNWNPALVFWKGKGFEVFDSPKY